MTDKCPVLTGGIPLHPANDIEKATERRKLRDHENKVDQLVRGGYEVVENARREHPARGTYQLQTWLLTPRRNGGQTK